MFAFWASAIGGIFIAVQWANRKNKKSPAPKNVIILSLKKRLDDGDITQEEYDKRINDL
jgi:putative membrane protein